jgi:hypothetical protein
VRKSNTIGFKGTKRQTIIGRIVKTVDEEKTILDTLSLKEILCLPMK